MQAGGYALHWSVALQAICLTAGGSVQRYAALHSKLYVAPSEKLLGALGPDSYCCCRAISAAVGSVHTAIHELCFLGTPVILGTPYGLISRVIIIMVYFLTKRAFRIQINDLFMGFQSL